MTNELVFSRRDDIAQGTSAWHDWRATVIGSSDAPAIMGENPWKSAKALLEEKLGIRKRFQGNAATRRGNALEPQARSIYEKYKGVTVTPTILQSKPRPWQAASVDGIDRACKVIVEIKCGIKSYEYTAKTGKVPHYYYGQLQHILAVSGLSFIDYFCYTPGNKELFYKVARDDSYINRLISAEHEFYRLLIDKGAKLAGDQPHQRSAIGTETLLQKVKIPEGYSGEKVNGKAHGQGTYLWPNGDKYVGEWLNGTRHGQGSYIWSSGEKYVGEWTSNEWTGIGTHYLLDGRTYSGQMLKGVRHGQGKMTFTDGATYSGEWKNGMRDGHGVMTFSNGDEYIGEWRKDHKDGLGSYTWSNGDKYVGSWCADQSNGQGSYTWSSGANYDGEWKNGRRHGSGIYKFKNGELHSSKKWKNGEAIVSHPKSVDKYKSDDVRHSKNGKPDGRGTLTGPKGERHSDNWASGLLQKEPELIGISQTKKVNPKANKVVETDGVHYADGSRYVGDLKKGKRHGSGTIFYPDGSTYSGKWKNNKRHGYGIYILREYDAKFRSNYSGNWKNDQFHGSGAFTWNSGAQYIGNWVDGCMQGSGAYTSPDGSQYIGDWFDNTPNGEGTLKYSNGDKYNGSWKLGARQGNGIMDYGDGDRYVGPWNKDRRVYPTLGGGLTERATIKLRVESVPMVERSSQQRRSPMRN